MVNGQQSLICRFRRFVRHSNGLRRVEVLGVLVLDMGVLFHGSSRRRPGAHRTGIEPKRIEPERAASRRRNLDASSTDGTPMRASSVWPSMSVVLLLVVGACSSVPSERDIPAVKLPKARERKPDLPSADPDVAPTLVTPNETAGMRLEPIYRQTVGSDGSMRVDLRAWYDSERDETCVFQKLTDGKVHCAPYGEAPVLDRDSFFADASCALPVIAFSQPSSDTGERCTDPSPVTKRYVRILGNRACDAPKLAAFPKAGRLAITTLYRKMSNGSCVKWPLVDQPYEVFESPMPLEEIDPSTFVTMTSTDDTPATDHRLRTSRTILDGADGSRSVSSWRIVDSARNEFCDDQTDQNGDHRCMPYGASLYASDFSDPGCTRPAWQVSNDPSYDEDGRNTYARYVSRMDACGRIELVSGFTARPASTLYYGSPAACVGYGVSADGASNSLYYASPLPQAMAPTSFSPIARIERDAPAGYYGKSGARLSRRMAGSASPDGFESLPYVTAYDRELATACSPMTLQDGKTYCVGGVDDFTFEPSDGLFSDPSCNEAVAGVAKRNPDCEPTEGVTNARFLTGAPYSQNGCETHRLYHPSEPVPVATLYFRDERGACVASAIEGHGHDVYRVSDLTEVLPSTFVEVTTTLLR